MGKQKKKLAGNHKCVYIGPHCGNLAPFSMRADRPIVCKYCRYSYYSDERVMVPAEH